MTQSSQTDRYVVKSLLHATEILKAFNSPQEVLRLRDIVERTGFHKNMCFRLLHTLHLCGFVEKASQNQYRMISQMQPRRKYRIGYAAQGQDSSFAREVHNGLLSAANTAEVELIIVNNRYDPKTALRNADYLIREQVELVIEFQTDEAVAPAIAAKYLEAQISIVAIDIPHPGAIYFGANNYEAGLIGGRHLGRWARKCWEGEVDEILLVELSRAGSLVRTRARGTIAGIKETLRVPDTCLVVHIDGDGQFKTALENTRRHLRTTKAKRILIGAANDPSALGALRAFEEAGRASHCAVVGHNCEPEARLELREPRTHLIGSVAYFPEKYGEGLIRLVLDVLGKKPTPPAMFMKHQLVTPENVDHYYPNDSLLGVNRMIS